MRNVRAGDELSNENIRAIRPGGGCSPKYFEQVLGRHFKKDFKIGSPLNLEDID